MSQDFTEAFREVLARLKIPYSEKGNRLEMRCIFHDDRTPSSGVYKSTGRFYCFACDLSLNAAQFLAKFTGEDEVRTTKDLEGKFGQLGIVREPERVLHERHQRLKAEHRLQEERANFVSRVGYGTAMETLDRIFFLSESDTMTREEFDKYFEMWYNSIEDGEFQRMK